MLNVNKHFILEFKSESSSTWQGMEGGVRQKMGERMKAIKLGVNEWRRMDGV